MMTSEEQRTALEASGAVESPPELVVPTVDTSTADSGNYNISHPATDSFNGSSASGVHATEGGDPVRRQHKEAAVHRFSSGPIESVVKSFTVIRRPSIDVSKDIRF